MSMSSRYTSQKSDIPWSASCMNHWNVLGALVSPKGMTLNSNRPNLQANAALCWCSGAMHIWWYPHCKSRLLNTQFPLRRSNNSSMRGMGYWSRCVLALSEWKSTQRRRLPSFFVCKKNRMAIRWRGWLDPSLGKHAINLFLEFIQLRLGYAIASKLGRLLGLINQINTMLDTCIWGWPGASNTSPNSASSFAIAV